VDGKTNLATIQMISAAKKMLSAATTVTVLLKSEVCCQKTPYVNLESETACMVKTGNIRAKN
jgi:hypothetical protein